MWKKVVLLFGTSITVVVARLELVHLVFRHGQRTPDATYPTDPYANYTFFPYGLGQLTNKGKQDQFEQGVFIRKRYNAFLGKIHSPRMITVQSSDIDRTYMSAQLAMAGLWASESSQKWNPGLNWQPIAVHSKPITEDNAVEHTEPTQVESPEHSRLIKVAIVGVPNSGKSTLINQLVGQRICGTSSKVHTTRLKAKAILNEGKTQIVFLDTPGLVGEIQIEKHNLEKSFLKDGITAARLADVICIVHDAANKWTCNELDERVIKLLTSLRNKRSLLILNKVDIMRSKRKLLDLVRTLMGKDENSSGKGWPRFEQTFMVSALTGSGLPELKNYLLDISNPGPWLFDAGTSTDTPSETLIEQAVRAALLENLPEEVPYRIRPQIEHYHELRDGTVNAVVLVQCPLPRTQRLVMGSKGWRIKKIAQEAEQQLQSALNTTVMLKLVVTDFKV